MQKALAALAALILLLGACKSDNKSGDKAEKAPAPGASVTMLAGHWVAMDFCARANQYGSVLAAMNNAHLPYSYAFSFNAAKPDSVECFNGFEDYFLPIHFSNDTVEIKGARQGKSVYLVYDSQDSKELTLFDATTGQANTDRFIKSKAEAKNGYSAFLAALNHNLFSGSFHLTGKGADPKAKSIQFSPGGFIMNFAPYDRYEVCTGGDCFVGEEPIDIITLSNSKKEGSEKMFGFKYDGGNDNLTFYNLIDKNPKEKGAVVLGAPAYQFSRKKAN